ncbi:hypothetical protein RAD15_06720 [Bradyrhizobium sp. 14AA]
MAFAAMQGGRNRSVDDATAIKARCDQDKSSSRSRLLLKQDLHADASGVCREGRSLRFFPDLWNAVRAMAVPVIPGHQPRNDGEEEEESEN